MFPGSPEEIRPQLLRGTASSSPGPHCLSSPSAPAFDRWQTPNVGEEKQPHILTHMKLTLDNRENCVFTAEPFIAIGLSERLDDSQVQPERFWLGCLGHFPTLLRKSMVSKPPPPAAPHVHSCRGINVHSVNPLVFSSLPSFSTLTFQAYLHGLIQYCFSNWISFCLKNYHLYICTPIHFHDPHL